MPQDIWLTIPDSVFRAGGLLTRWQIYSAALEHRIEARRKGRSWELRRASLDRYLADLQTKGATR